MGGLNGAAQSVALSADGRWVAFTAENASGDDDLYLFDRNEGALTPVTVALDGASSNGWVGAAAMVPDGRYLAFYAWASNLVDGDTNAVQDLFFYDRDEGTISRISVSASGGQANDRSGDSSGAIAPAISADGQIIAFDSAASNLTSGDGNGRVDVFVHDRQTVSTTLISHGPDGVAGNGDSSQPALSADGRFVLFQSHATNLDPSVPTLATPGATQIYLHDRNDGSTRLISRGPDGRPGNDESSAPSISGDGRYLVYASRPPILWRVTATKLPIFSCMTVSRVRLDASLSHQRASKPIAPHGHPRSRWMDAIFFLAPRPAIWSMATATKRLTSLSMTNWRATPAASRSGSVTCGAGLRPMAPRVAPLPSFLGGGWWPLFRKRRT